MSYAIGWSGWALDRWRAPFAQHRTDGKSHVWGRSGRKEGRAQFSTVRSTAFGVESNAEAARQEGHQVMCRGASPMLTAENGLLHSQRGPRRFNRNCLPALRHTPPKHCGYRAGRGKSASKCCYANATETAGAKISPTSPSRRSETHGSSSCAVSPRLMMT